MDIRGDGLGESGVAGSERGGAYTWGRGCPYLMLNCHHQNDTAVSWAVMTFLVMASLIVEEGLAPLSFPLKTKTRRI